VFRTIAALALASASANPSTALTANAPWWEKVTVTVTDDGQTQSCRYESSLTPNAGKNCSVVGNAASMTHHAGAKDQYTRITFERRFSPDAQPDLASVQPGETLLGGQVMALAIDGKGAVTGCRIVQSGGDVTPQYGCSEAEAERFTASAVSPRARAAGHEGYMTILVYGHSEHVV
jgi:hypothetical protein